MVGAIGSGSGSVSGYAYYPSTLAISNRVFMTVDALADGRSLVHELGHYFNLLHTFHNNANPNVSLRELVTRSAGANCTTAGDQAVSYTHLDVYKRQIFSPSASWKKAGCRVYP